MILNKRIVCFRIPFCFELSYIKNHEIVIVLIPIRITGLLGFIRKTHYNKNYYYFSLFFFSWGIL